ncbi:MAG: FtsH protease activity modulator HflK [Planctomycetes bacterium]|nr:FtsH protease activity modulator HflK [Planctomycetota bacterium]
MKIPDDFSEWERRLRSVGKGRSIGKPSGRLILTAIALLVALIGVLSAYYTVAPEGKAVVTRFGAVHAVQEPGLHFKLPFGIDVVHFVPTERVLKEEFGFRTDPEIRPGSANRYARGRVGQDEALMLTGDLNVINVEWVVQYQIAEPEDYLFQVNDPTQTIRDVSESVMRRVVGNRIGSDVLTVGRPAIAAAVKEEMNRILRGDPADPADRGYRIGVKVTAVEMQDVTPPDVVAPAFNEVNEARQQKERAVNLAEKERNQVLPRAKGEAEQVVSEAEAYATERVNAARGETARFVALLEEYRKAEEITRQRLFLEMVDAVLPRIRSLYVMDSNGTSPLPLLNLDGSALPGARQGGDGR